MSDHPAPDDLNLDPNATPDRSPAARQRIGALLAQVTASDVVAVVVDRGPHRMDEVIAGRINPSSVRVEDDLFAMTEFSGCGRILKITDVCDIGLLVATDGRTTTLPRP